MLWKPEITNFMKFPKKFNLQDKRGFILMETRRAERLLPPGQPPFTN